MELIREQTIDADPLTVWAALNDDDILKASIPGCESVERIEPDTIRAVVKIKVGPVGARFSGVVKFSDQRPPHGYKITFEGQGGAAGFAKGHATVDLRPHGTGSTVLAYEAHAQVGGRLAQIGSRLIDNVAAKTAEEFFAAFSRQLSPQPETTTPVAPPRTRFKPGTASSAATSTTSTAGGAQVGLNGLSRVDVAAIRTSLSIMAGCSVVLTAAAVAHLLYAVF